MIDSQSGLVRKNRVNLDDSDLVKDIEARTALSHLKEVDVLLLEEILYHSAKFPIEDLQESLELPLPMIKESLERLYKTGLFAVEGDTILINKEKRKFLEIDFERFKEDFTPGLEFIRLLLKKLPIHVLPNWYQIHKATNNIFDSLIEKYFITPHTFERYLMETSFQEEIFQSIVDEVFKSPDLKIPSSLLKKKFSLTEEAFAEMMLFFEYSFILFSTFEMKEGEYIEMITPLHEWREYLLFIKNTVPQAIADASQIEKFREDEYAFSTDMASYLALCPLPVCQSRGKLWSVDPKVFPQFEAVLSNFDFKDPSDLLSAKTYLSKLTQKLLMLGLAKIEDGMLTTLQEAKEWSLLDKQKRAFYTYKHPSHQIPQGDFSSEINTSRNIREIEKSISRIVDKGWVYFNDFMKGVLVALTENSKLEIRREGAHWKWAIPKYTAEELSFIETTILEWLFESGIVQIGIHEGQTCLMVTPLGCSLFIG